MKSMKSMKRDDIMNMDDIMEKLYVGLDIHEKYITGTAMRKDGRIAFSGDFPNTTLYKSLERTRKILSSCYNHIII